MTNKEIILIKDEINKLILNSDLHYTKQIVTSNVNKFIDYYSGSITVNDILEYLNGIGTTALSLKENIEGLLNKDNNYER